MSASSLSVYYDEHLVGELRRQEDGRPQFQYDRRWLVSPDTFAISVRLPLREQPFTEESETFFYNLLPEGNVRALVARRVGVSVDNDFELLAAIGGECAGALTLLRPGDPPKQRSPKYRPLAAKDLLKLAAQGSVMAMLDGDAGLRLSLAGAQDKIPVRLDGDQILLPEQGSASTHILKFESAAFKHLPANEVFTMMLASEVGLQTASATLKRVGRHTLYVVERFDRRLGGNDVRRLHQEDLCQALALPASRKYEKEGGPPFVDCYRLVVDVSTSPLIDGKALLNWCAFNAIALNADGHAKNLSILYGPEGPRLAPAYDLVCTRAYPALDRHLAMSIAGQSDPTLLLRRHWEGLAVATGVGSKFLLGLVAELAERMDDALRKTTRAFEGRYGRSPAVQMIVRHVRKQAKRIAQQLRAHR